MTRSEKKLRIQELENAEKKVYDNFLAAFDEGKRRRDAK